MKKKLFLPLLTVTVLASQAWAASYTSCATDLGKAYFCDWGTGCYELNKGVNDADICTEVYSSCKENGYLFTGSTTLGDDKKCNGTWAEEGNDPNFNDGVRLWCKWTSGCQPVRDSVNLAKCIKDGSVFKDVPKEDEGEGKTCAGGTWTEQGKDPNAVALGCCNWDDNGCYKVYDEIKWGQCAAKYKYNSCTEPLDGSAGRCLNPISVSSSSVVASSSSKAPSSSSGVSSSSIASSSSSSASISSSSSTSISSSSSAGISSSSSVSSSSSSNSSSSSSDDSDPIISYNKTPVIGLTVVHFARSLQIASGKNATVALFDMRGKQVLSQKVLSGTTTISLQKQRQGIYYAVVKSNSHKQIVKVVLK